MQSREQSARVTFFARTRSQCFQSLNEVGHYEQAIAARQSADIEKPAAVHVASHLA
jgi:hypothetical protein